MVRVFQVALLLVGIYLCFLVFTGYKVDTSTSLSFAQQLAMDTRESSERFVYEGLPHQSFETDFLEKELKRSDIIKLGDFHFYTPKIQLNEEHWGSIRKILTKNRSFEPVVGAKLCGPFHPDYAIEWVSNGQTHWVQLCFGCGDVSTSRGNYVWLQSDAENDLVEILKAYDLKRPTKDEIRKERKLREFEEMLEGLPDEVKQKVMKEFINSLTP